MIIRITNKVDGIVRYLLTGTKNDRDQKDHRLPIWGDLSLTNHAINHLKKTRKYKKNYMHMTASFSERDERHLRLLSEEERFKHYQLLVKKILNAYFPHRNINDDYMPYAELHDPTDTHQYNSEGMRRLPHIHIVIPLLDLKTQNQLRAVPFSVPFNASVQSSICEEMGLEDPIHQALKRAPNKKRTAKPISKAGDLSDKLAERIHKAEITTETELIDFVNAQPEVTGVRIVSGKTSRYIKATTTIQKSTKRGGYHQINLRGERFPIIEELLNPSKPRPTNQPYSPKPRVLKKVSESRTIRNEIIKHATHSFNANNKNHQLRPQKEKRRRLYLADLNQYVDELSRSQKQFYRIYKANIDSELVKNTNIWSDKKNHVTVISSRKVTIVDHGDELTSTSSEDIQQMTLLMLEIALKKGWALDDINASGSEQFIKQFEQLRALKRRERIQSEEIVENTQTVELFPEDSSNPTVDGELEIIPKTPSNNEKPTHSSKHKSKPIWKPFA